MAGSVTAAPAAEHNRAPVRASAQPRRAAPWPLWLFGGLLVMVTAALLRSGALTGAAAPPARPPATAPSKPTIVTSELRYATRPADGVWAELTLILDNPLPSTADGWTSTVLFVPGSLLEDFRIRATEPTLIDEPRQRSDGRYAFTFPPALAQTLNWYRLEMEVRRHRPRPVQVSLLFDRPLFETRPTGVRVIYADREADPFSVVPEPILGWLPGRSTSALPLLVGYTAVLGVIVTAGCAAAFRVVRRG